MKDFFDRHERVGLLFSGGKDSLTCLYKCKPYWHKLVVLWANTGKNFPEIKEFIEQIKKEKVTFIEVRSNQDHFVKTEGYPTEVVAARCTPAGRLVATEPYAQPVVSKYECCAHNLWRPIQAAMDVCNCTGFIKGQRQEDHWHAPWDAEIEVNGRHCEVFYPIRGLTTEECLQFLVDEGVELTERFKLGRTSMDCWDCTGYWEYVPARLEYMKARHPEKYEHVIRIFKNIKADVTTTLNLLPQLGEQ